MNTEKINKYIERTQMGKESSRYIMSFGDLKLFKELSKEDCCAAIILAFQYGRAKGYRAAAVAAHDNILSNEKERRISSMCVYLRKLDDRSLGICDEFITALYKSQIEKQHTSSPPSLEQRGNQFH